MTGLRAVLGRTGAYWLVAFALAILFAAWVYWSDTRPYLPCPDGHCPDPGSHEERWALARRVARAPQSALIAFAGAMLLAMLLRLAWLGLGALARYLSRDS